jgi:hypothetical protein
MFAQNQRRRAKNERKNECEGLGSNGLLLGMATGSFIKLQSLTGECV